MIDSKLVKKCAEQGICPDCGKLLRLSKTIKKRWFRKDKKIVTGVECPNGHNLDFNKLLNFKKPIWRDTEIHYDLSDYTNIIYENTAHKSIKLQYDRFYAWLYD